MEIIFIVVAIIVLSGGAEIGYKKFKKSKIRHKISDIWFWRSEVEILFRKMIEDSDKKPEEKYFKKFLSLNIEDSVENLIEKGLKSKHHNKVEKSMIIIIKILKFTDIFQDKRKKLKLKEIVQANINHRHIESLLRKTTSDRRKTFWFLVDTLRRELELPTGERAISDFIGIG